MKTKHHQTQENPICPLCDDCGHRSEIVEIDPGLPGDETVGCPEIPATLECPRCRSEYEIEVIEYEPEYDAYSYWVILTNHRCVDPAPTSEGALPPMRLSPPGILKGPGLLFVHSQPLEGREETRLAASPFRCGSPTTTSPLVVRGRRFLP